MFKYWFFHLANFMLPSFKQIDMDSDPRIIKTPLDEVDDANAEPIGEREITMSCFFLLCYWYYPETS